MRSAGKEGFQRAMVDTRMGGKKKPFSVLHYEILEYAARLEMTEAERRRRVDAFDKIRKVVLELWPGVEVVAFGSFATGLSLPGSDLDLSLMPVSNSHPGSYPVSCDESPPGGKGWLLPLSKRLWRHQLVAKLRKIARARVPIIKCVMKGSNLSVDIAFGATNGPKVIPFVREKLTQCYALKPLCLILKVFLSQRSLNEVFTGGVGSYCLLAMALRLVQKEGLMGVSSPSGADIGNLLRRFFVTYTTEHDYERDVVCARVGGRGLDATKRERGWLDDRRPDALSVEDPQAPDADIGKAAYRIDDVRRAFGKARAALDAAWDRAGLLGKILDLNKSRECLGRPISHPVSDWKNRMFIADTRSGGNKRKRGMYETSTQYIDYDDDDDNDDHDDDVDCNAGVGREDEGTQLAAGGRPGWLPALKKKRVEECTIVHVTNEKNEPEDSNYADSWNADGDGAARCSDKGSSSHPESNNNLGNVSTSGRKSKLTKQKKKKKPRKRQKKRADKPLEHNIDPQQKVMATGFEIDGRKSVNEGDEEALASYMAVREEWDAQFLSHAELDGGGAQPLTNGDRGAQITSGNGYVGRSDVSGPSGIDRTRGLLGDDFWRGGGEQKVGMEEGVLCTVGQGYKREAHGMDGSEGWDLMRLDLNTEEAMARGKRWKRGASGGVSRRARPPGSAGKCPFIECKNEADEEMCRKKKRGGWIPEEGGKRNGCRKGRRGGSAATGERGGERLQSTGSSGDGPLVTSKYRVLKKTRKMGAVGVRSVGSNGGWSRRIEHKERQRQITSRPTVRSGLRAGKKNERRVGWSGWALLKGLKKGSLAGGSRRRRVVPAAMAR